MIDPTVDPIFSNPDMQQLLMTFRRDQVQNIARDLSTIGYSYSPVPYNANENDKYTARPNAEDQNTTGLFDMATSAAVLQNFSGRAIFNADRFISGLTADSDPNAKPFKVGDWFADPRNRAYLSNLSAGQGQNIVQNWIAGDYNSIKRESELFAVLAYDMTEAHYRDAAMHADPLTGFAGGMVGAGADPLGMVGGAALMRVGGKVLVAFDAADQAAMAARLSALGVRINKTDSVATAAGKAMLAGTAYTAVTETGLHALDKNRTADETVNNLAGNIVFNSALAAGLGHLSGMNWLKPTTHLTVEPRLTLGDLAAQQRAELPSIDAAVGKEMQAKIDEALGGLATPEPKPEIAGLLTTDRPNPENDVPISGRDLITNYGRKLESAQTIEEAQRAATIADQKTSLVGALSEKVQEIITGDKAPDDFSKLLDEIFAAKQEIDTARAKKAAGIQSPESVAKPEAPQQAPLNGETSPVVDPLAADPHAGEGGISSEVKHTDVPPSDAEISADQTTPTGGSVQVRPNAKVEPGVGGSTTGYADYLPDLGISKDRLQSILELTDKYLNNRVLGKNITVNSVQFSTNPQLQMFYQKMFRSIFPSKAAAEGLVQGAAPFESVAGMMRKKGLAVQYAVSESFRDWIRQSDPSLYTRIITNHNVGRELWYYLPGARELVLKEQQWYSAMDALRQLRADGIEHLRTYLNPDVFAEMQQSLAEARKAGRFRDVSDVVGTFIMMSENKAWGKVYGQGPTKAMAGVGLDSFTPDQWLKLGIVLDEQMPKLGQLRERLRPSYSKYADPLLEQKRRDYSLAQTSIALPDDLSMQEFTNFWNTAYGSGDTPQTLLRYFIENFKNISENELTNPTQATVNRLRNTWEREMGGFVPKSRITDVMALTRQDGTNVASLDLRRTIGLNARLMEQLELAHTLRDYLAEATQWDGRLKQQIRVAGEMNAPLTMLDTFDGLTVNRMLRGQVEPDAGFFQELRAWNERALSTIETNMKDTAMEYNSDHAGNPLDQAKREQEKRLMQDFFHNVRTRTDMTAGASTRESHVIKRNLFSFTRNLFLGSQGLTNMQDFGQAVAATALSPFRGDFMEGFRGIASSLRDAKLQGRDMGALLDNIEYTGDELRDVLLNRTSQGEYDPTLGADVSKPSPGEALASFQERVASEAIQTLSLGQTVADAAKSMSLLSTIHQLTYKDGLVIGLDKVLTDIEGGMSLADALAKHNVPDFYAKQALKYLSAADVHEIAALIRDDTTRQLSTPRRFFLSKVMGDQKITLLDLPENSTSAQRSAMESLGMLANDLATREKLAMPGWGEDILGSNGTSKQILAFWFRPNIALFNRAYLGQANKPLLARFGIIGTMLMAAAAIDLAKAAANGPDQLDKKLQNIHDNFYAWAAGRIGWSGGVGFAGEKAINFATAMLDPQPGSAMLGAPGQREITPAPLGALGTLFQGTLGAGQGLFGKGTTRPNADAAWKVLSATGLSNDTLTFKLISRFGDLGGVSSPSDNPVNIKNFWYDRLGVPADKRR